LLLSYAAQYSRKMIMSHVAKCNRSLLIFTQIFTYYAFEQRSEIKPIALKIIQEYDTTISIIVLCRIRLRCYNSTVTYCNTKIRKILNSFEMQQ